MPFDFLTDDPFVRRIVAGGLLAGFVVLSAALFVLVRIVADRLGRGGARRLAPDVVRAIGRPGALLVGAGGIFIALLLLPDAAGLRADIARVWAVVAIVLIGQSAVNVTRATIGWYLVNVAPRTATKFDDRMLPLIRRMLVVSIYGLVLLFMLNALGLSVSPILGGLGITGLAVALALQPTLGNFFAGTYVMSEGVIAVGDYIELDTGVAGYVVDVGWRSTKVRTWHNNLVIIPNSVMADHVITNYSAPTQAINIMVTCGVSYSSDLDHVERVALDVAQEVIDDVSASVKNMQPYFGFDEFGDSNVNFWIFLQAEDRGGSFVVKNQLIKRLHARFAAEGIEINYPVRKLVYDASAPPPLREQAAQ